MAGGCCEGQCRLQNILFHLGASTGYMTLSKLLTVLGLSFPICKAGVHLVLHAHVGRGAL
jgi:hypothetical protein